MQKATTVGFVQDGPLAASNRKWKTTAHKHSSLIEAVMTNGSDEARDERIREMEKALRPKGYDAMVEASQILQMTPVEFAFWLLYPSSFLGGRRPCDVYEEEPELFVLAAKDQATGMLQG